MSEFETVAARPTARTASCTNCGAELEANARFCSLCGCPVAAVTARSFCQKCGAELSGDELYCSSCGEPTSRVRNEQVMNNIAAYNQAILSGWPLKPKKQVLPLSFKPYSVLSVIAWVVCVLITGLSAVPVMDVVAELIDPLRYGVSAYNAVRSFLPFVLTLAATVCGVFAWNGKKMTRVITVCVLGAAMLAVANYGHDFRWLFTDFRHTWRLFTCLLPALGMLAVLLLTVLNVIKSKRLIVILVSSLSGVFVLTPLIAEYMEYAFYLLPFMAVMVLLLLSFTHKETAEAAPKKRQVIKAVSTGLLVAILLSGVGTGVYDNWTYLEDYTGEAFEDVMDDYYGDDVRILYPDAEYVYSDTVEKGVVIEQSVDGEQYVRSESYVYFVVSKGPGVDVPDLAGMSEAEAKQTLSDLGVEPEVTYEFSDTVANGKVISNSSGQVDEGAAISVVVSKGKGAAIPDLLGLTEENAASKLRSLGFKVKTVYVYEECDAYEETTEVVGQSLRGMQAVGTTVTINVTKPSISILQANHYLNYVDGVDVEVLYKNTSSKTISRVDFTTRFKNSYGNDVYCEIRDTSVRDIYSLQTLSPGSTYTAYWDAVIYNGATSQIHFDKIVVTFTDGTTHTMIYNGYWYK